MKKKAHCENERQVKVVLFAKEKGKITNSDKGFERIAIENRCMNNRRSTELNNH